MNPLKKVSLCMIVKNEEQLIENCFRSVRDIVDEMIVVDTGSTDQTVDIAQSLGAVVYYFDWNGDFSEARNFSINQASGEWILFLDADEELDRRDQNKLRSLIDNGDPDADAYLFKVFSYFGRKKETEKLWDGRVSLFKNHKGFRFKGAIHEEIVTSINENLGRIVSADVRIIHYGYLDEVVARKEKTRRNKKIILDELAKPGDNLFLQYALAVEFLQEENYESASAILLDLAAQWEPNHPSYSDVLYKLCLSFKELRRFEQCREWLEKGIGLFPDYTDLHYLKGSVDLELGNLEQAEESFLQCVALGSPPVRFYSFEGVGTFRAWYALGLIYEAQNQIRKAFEAYFHSFQQNVQFVDAVVRCIQCGIWIMDKSQFYQFIEGHFTVEHPETFLEIGKVFIKLNRFDYLLHLAKEEKIFRSDPRSYMYFSHLCEKMYEIVLNSKGE